MFAVQHPAYTQRNFENDMPSARAREQIATRVVRAALPFCTLYQPLHYPLGLSFGAIRCLNMSQWLSQDLSLKNYGHVAFAVAGLVGIYFRHPLGLFLTTLQDLSLSFSQLGVLVSQEEYSQAAIAGIQVIGDMLYASLFLGVSGQVVAVSLGMQFVLGMMRSYHHFQQEEEWVEGFSQLGMAFIRGHGAIRTYQQCVISCDIKQARDAGQPYLPLVNRVQKVFFEMGYRLNTLTRRSVQQIDNPVALLLTAPMMLTGMLLSVPCYLIGSYLGTGRFERIESTIPSLDVSKNEVRLESQNICAQNPWSIFTGGQPLPLEEGPSGKTRVDAIIEQILKSRPDIYCGQEYDDFDASRAIALALSKRGYTCIRDLGAHDPLRNSSGLFFALKDPAMADRVDFYPFAREHTHGLMQWCNRGLLTVQATLANGEKLQVINLHLNSGDTVEDQAARLAQLQHYVRPLMDKMPTIAVGDANLDTALLDLKDLLGMTNALEGQVTCTDEGKHLLLGKLREACNECAERIDVLLTKIGSRVKILETQIIPGHSDHHRIVSSVQFD